MVDSSPITLKITSNVNGLNTSTRVQRLSEWIKKRDPTAFCLQETLFKCIHALR